MDGEEIKPAMRPFGWGIRGDVTKEVRNKGAVVAGVMVRILIKTQYDA